MIVKLHSMWVKHSTERDVDSASSQFWLLVRNLLIDCQLQCFPKLTPTAGMHANACLCLLSSSASQNLKSAHSFFPLSWQYLKDSYSQLLKKICTCTRYLKNNQAEIILLFSLMSLIPLQGRGAFYLSFPLYSLIGNISFKSWIQQNTAVSSRKISSKRTAFSHKTVKEIFSEQFPALTVSFLAVSLLFLFSLLLSTFDTLPLQSALLGFR